MNQENIIPSDTEEKMPTPQPHQPDQTAGQALRGVAGGVCLIDGRPRVPVVIEIMVAIIMTQAYGYEAKALDALKRAVAEALERKRRLGQYAVL